jgi:predicted transposase YbfD/YdcC
MGERVSPEYARIETRKCSVLPAREFLMEESIAPWKSLQTIIRIQTTREIKGKSTDEIRYYISDESQERAAYFNALARGHWAIENQLHWHLDVTFKEDKCRTRTGYAPQNLAVLRKGALHLVSNLKDKLSIKKRLYKAALDSEYLKKVLGII